MMGESLLSQQSVIQKVSRMWIYCYEQKGFPCLNFKYILFSCGKSNWVVHKEEVGGQVQIRYLSYLYQLFVY